MTATYYVRIAGKVYGSFDAGKLKSLAAGGKLARDHEISRDRVKWVPAGNVKGLFPAQKLAEEAPRTAPVKTLVAPARPEREPLPDARIGSIAASREASVSLGSPGRQPQPPAQLVGARRSLLRNPCALVSALVASLAVGSCWIPSLASFAFLLALGAIVLAGCGLLAARFRGGAGTLASTLGASVAVLAIGISTALTGQGGRVTPIVTAPLAWAEFGTPQQVADVRVSIASVASGRVPLEGPFDEGLSTERLLVIRVTIENLSESRKIDFRGFDPELPALEFAQLTDNHQNSYRRVGFGTAKPRGQVQLESIYPGKSIDDVLVFEPPVGTAEFLRLELPARNVGHEGAFRFQIPCAALER